MPNTIILGSQWGDEGKGKVVDILAAAMDMVIRFQGGANAGHTVVFQNKKVILHHVPSGILYPHTRNIIGNGCVVDPIRLHEEISELEAAGIEVTPDNLGISHHAHMVTPFHRNVDIRENTKIGTTGRGIGPCYSDKINRCGIRLESIMNGTVEDDLIQRMETYRNHMRNYDSIDWNFDSSRQRILEVCDAIRPFICDTTREIAGAARSDQRILFEGAQGTLLDIDHGTFPYVTSSNTTIGGAFTGTGVYVDFTTRIAVVKAYTTRVGEGPFPTELSEVRAESLRKQGNEFGATTGRPRRCGWLDIPLLKRAFLTNGFNYVALTKLDCLTGISPLRVAIDRSSNGSPVYSDLEGWSESIEGITEYESLPARCRDYLQFIEEHLNMPVDLVSTGADRSHVIFRRALP